MGGIRVVIIDDHPLFREGVARSLAESGSFEIVGVGATMEDALRITDAKHPDIVLLDISMPGGGLNAIEPILDRNPNQKILMLTVSERTEDVTQALNAGAKGYLLKGVGSRELSEVLRAVAAGENYVSPTLSAQLLSNLSGRSGLPAMANPLATLTDREREILSLVASGLSNKHVALRLDLQEKTVKHHMTRILAKLEVSNRTQAAMVLRDAMENGAFPAA